MGVGWGVEIGTLVFMGEDQALLTHLAISLALSSFCNVVLSAMLAVIPCTRQEKI